MLEFKAVSFAYPSPPVEVVRNLSFLVRRGEVASLVGLSGRGKSTIARLALGLSRPDEGQVNWDGDEVRPSNPDLAAVFQNYNESLFGWLSVFRNVALAASPALSESALKRLVRDRIASAGLEKESQSESFLNRGLYGLSGGQKQRIALARSFVNKPGLLVLDEPFASLDYVNRKRLQQIIMKQRQEWGQAILLVTHDIDQAVEMSSSVIILFQPGQSPRTTLLPTPVEGRSLDRLASSREQAWAMYRTEIDRVLREDMDYPKESPVRSDLNG